MARKPARAARLISAAAAVVAASASPAFAHHVMGGAMPQTFLQGLLSGFGHPIIGIDHFAFVVAVGLASAFLANRWLPALGFVAATAAGALTVYNGIGLPLTELAVTASVVLAGGMVLSGRPFPAGLYAAVFALAGLFHGGAYAASIIGAETTPLVAYLAGFAVIQYTIVFATSWLVRGVWKAAAPAALSPRLAGAAVAGVGLALLAENIEGMLFG